jgi:pimeloyl-ACP methyl ester carboxylesterase
VVHGRDRRWIWYLIALVVIWAVLAFSSDVVGLFTHSDSKPFALRTVGKPCADDASWTCGSIVVPFDRASAAGGSLRVHFRVLPRELVDSPSAGMIVVVAGGPGQDSMSQAAWAHGTFRGFLTNHDLLLVDNRGTGTSDAINCPMLQAEQPDASVQAVAQCRALLGAHADDFSTSAAVDDLSAILARLHVGRIDLYGESYGTFFAQVFASRYPRVVQRLVLDGAYPLQVDPWRRDAIPTALAGLRAVCQADPICKASGDPVALVDRIVPALRARTVRGTTSDAFGRPVTIVGSVTDLAYALDEAGRNGTIYRELPAALAAATHTPADPIPLLRLLAERPEPVLAQFGAPDTATRLSIGLLVADTCADYPHPFTLTDPLAQQTNELAAARHAFLSTARNRFTPFEPNEAAPTDAFCLGWPPPTNLPLPTLLSGRATIIPTVVLEGSLDTITPPPGARAVASQFHHSRYVEIPYVGHVTALSDKTHCAAGIAAQFLATGVIDTACATRTIAPPHVESFPRTMSEELPAATVLQTHATLSTDDRRIIATARDVITDCLWQWGTVGILSGPGLRGGTFAATGPLSFDPIDLNLDAIHWTADTTITGQLRVDPERDSVAGTITVSLATQQIRLGIHSNLFGNLAAMTFTGTLHDHPLDYLTTGALGL